MIGPWGRKMEVGGAVRAWITPLAVYYYLHIILTSRWANMVVFWVWSI